MQIQVTEWGEDPGPKSAMPPQYCAIHYRILLSAEEVNRLRHTRQSAPLNEEIEALDNNTFQLLAEQHELRNMGLWELAERIEQAVREAEAARSGGSATACAHRPPSVFS